MEGEGCRWARESKRQIMHLVLQKLLFVCFTFSLTLFFICLISLKNLSFLKTPSCHVDTARTASHTRPQAAGDVHLDGSGRGPSAGFPSSHSRGIGRRPLCPGTQPERCDRKHQASRKTLGWKAEPFLGAWELDARASLSHRALHETLSGVSQPWQM